MSLTGDPVTDALIPAAMRLIGAVHAGDPLEMDEAVGDAILATGGRCDPAMALAVLCAAMVPEDAKPSALLAWMPELLEFERLTEKGVDPKIAGQLAGRTNRTAA